MSKLASANISLAIDSEALYVLTQVRVKGDKIHLQLYCPDLPSGVGNRPYGLTVDFKNKKLAETIQYIMKEGLYE